MKKIGALALTLSLSAHAAPASRPSFSSGGRASGGFGGTTRAAPTPAPRAAAPAPTRNYGSGTRSYNYGGSATATLPTPAYRNSQIRVSPRAAKLGAILGAGAIVGAGVYAHNHNATPTIAESSHEAFSAASARRAASPRPANVTSTSTSYSRDEGYLQPSFTSMVFNPLYFWLPFNVWHPHARPATANAPSRVAEDHGTFTQDTYREGEVGADEINQLPAWAQASLRLMNADNKGARPETATVLPSTVTQEQWQSQRNELNQDVAVWTAKKREITEYTTAKARVETMRRAQGDLLAQIPVLEKEELARQETARSARETVAADTKRAVESREELMKRKDTFWCHTFPYLGCGSSEIVAQRSTAEMMERAADSSRDRADEAARQARSAQYELEQHRSAIRNIQTQLPDAEAQAITLAGRVADASEVDARLAEATQKLTAHQGLYKMNAAQPGCDTDSLYAYDGAQNPLFPNAKDLGPKGLTLAVCLIGDRVTGVYVLQDKELAYRTAITRDESGAIDRLEILDGDGKSLETHEWVRTSDGTLRYLFTFASGEAENTSIYADLPK